MRIQKPGLALSGFVKHVYPDRIQVLGLTDDREERILLDELSQTAAQERVVFDE